MAVLIDTDAGFDDIAALALLAGWCQPDTIRLVTTVHGMCPPQAAPLLIRRVLVSLGLGAVPVVGGEARAPDGSDVVAAEPWGATYRSRLAAAPELLGLTAAEPEPEGGSRRSAAEAIIAEAAAAGGATVLALGALTNVAAAASHAPAEFKRHVHQVIFQCRCFAGDGGDRPFNARFDASAVQTVLAAGVPVTLVSGAQCYPSEEWVAAQLGKAMSAGAPAQPDGRTPAVEAAAAMLRALATAHPASIQYDPVAAAFFLAPDSFVVQEGCPVHVATDGRMAFDEGGGSGTAVMKAAVAQSLDMAAFAQLLLLPATMAPTS